jgi:xylulokinase
VTANLKAVYEEAIAFDKDLPNYGVQGGVHKNEEENEVYAPVAMWIEALDLILSRMKEKGFDFSTVKGVAGAGQQHGSV